MIIYRDWNAVRKLGAGSFGAVYEVENTDPLREGEKAAIKCISIPQTESEVERLKSENYDDASISNTFKEQLSDIVKEYRLMQELSGNTNIVNCRDMGYIQHDDGFGWDLFIVMELLTPLRKLPMDHFSEDEIVRAGRDLCKALTVCRRHSIIHRDIKPDNIFYSADGAYKLGDFGISRVLEGADASTRSIGTYEYMAPEVQSTNYTYTADIYSLGLVLYWLLNERRTPFLPLPPAAPTTSVKEQAKQRRFSGEQIPAPAHGSKELKHIVLKACAFDPLDRYQSAEEMLADLELLSHEQTEDFPSFSVSSAIAASDAKESNTEGKTTSKENHIDVTAEAGVPAGSLQRDGKCDEGKTAGSAALGCDDKTVSAFDNRKSGDELPEKTNPDDSASGGTVGAFDRVPQKKQISPSERTGQDRSSKKKRGLTLSLLCGLAILAGVWAINGSNQKGASKEENAAQVSTIDNAAAYEVSEAIQEPTPKPTAEPTSELVSVEISKAEAGDVIRFGTYELDGNTENGKEDIEWIVLSTDNNKLLATTRFAVASMPYSRTLRSMPYRNPVTQKTYNIQACTWENSTLRKWLNSEFYNTAFGSKEKKAIVTVTNDNLEHGEEYNEYVRQEGPKTKDKVFLLSEDEVNRYFTTEGSGSLLVPQSLINANVQYSKSTGTIQWWTRTLGSTPGDHAMVVSVLGKVLTDCEVSAYERGVRPVILIDRTKLSN